MEKRYQVFLSSTYLDLREARQKVIQAFLDSSCIPSGMELFPASPETVWKLIQRMIDECDYFVLLVAGKYGSMDKQGNSYTEREFDYALRTKKPIMAFVRTSTPPLPIDAREEDPKTQKKLDRFVKKVKERVTSKRWSTVEELQREVGIGLHVLMKEQPAEGWVRGRYATDPEVAEKERKATLSRLMEVATRFTAYGSGLGRQKTRGFCHIYNSETEMLVPFATYTDGRWDRDRTTEILCSRKQPKCKWYIVAKSFLQAKSVVEDVDWERPPRGIKGVDEICKHIRSVIAYPIQPLDGRDKPIGTISCDSQETAEASGWTKDSELDYVFTALADAAYQLLKKHER
jgi:hypothetical protein